MSHRVPDWYRNAKLGIMVHWGLSSIPAFAPSGHGSIADILAEHDWPFYFRNNPYSEWYLNSLRLKETATGTFHNRKFNRSYPYERLADRFNDDIKKWEPSDWAELFAEAGARYVVLVAKHHDGFLLWPSDHKPKPEGYVAGRDVVGELGEAVRARNLRYGLYYSGLLDWTVQTEPIAEFGDLLNVQTDTAYATYVQHHFTELITRHRPDILWNDIGLPGGISRRELFRLYRETVNEGVLNDRWMQISPLMQRMLTRPGLRRRIAETARKSLVGGESVGKLGDVPTAEYAKSTRLRSEPWEVVRSIGNSFGYNEQESPEDYLTGDELVRMLVDIVSKNGNLLLNVGPKSDGTIPREQRTPLLDLAAWLRVNGEAIYDTRPWHRAEGESGDGQPVRFTTRPDTLYAIVLERPRRLSLELPNLELKRIPRPEPAPGTEDELTVSLLGCELPIQWRVSDRSVEIQLPGAFVPVGPMVVAFRWQPVDLRARPIEMYTDVIG
ncbi:MAG: alpha-L-fucosidase [Spirochaetales bacterium]|nr:alpha-L-fucosidase [Spirochaetales bacterium]